ncbi:hypothetical protein [Candidatus Francisella endociliophora]|uniref:hypothetical protein n=1 Tax=Candidatus Francisella endociliophora TaxID=653937 RepID=UPI0006935282|nr:hypothetical protein [Francisella sp. FSC1006]
MNKLYLSITVTTVILLSSCSTNNTIIKGGDYVSMQPDTQFHYKRTALEAKKSIFIDLDIEFCNKDQSKCRYYVTVKNDKNKVIEKFYETYKVNFFGDVFLTDSLYPSGTLLLPARMELGDEIQISNNDKFGPIQEKLLAYKIIPKIQINNNNYNNCVNILFETITPTETLDLKLTTDEITCKNIGTVRKEMKMSYKPKYANTSTDEISNSVMKYASTQSIAKSMGPMSFYKPFITKKAKPDSQGYILIDTYLDILQSISHNPSANPSINNFAPEDKYN